MTPPLVLNLGCGNLLVPGAVNHDLRKHSAGVDVVHDLNIQPWPWDDNSFDAIFGIDVVEHLDKFFTFFDECWRILKPGGQLTVQTPRWNSLNGVLDPTHVRTGYHIQSFDYLDPDTQWGGKYHFYTERHWRIVKRVDEDNLIVVMEPRK